MSNNIATKSRRLLINIGKVLPFVICFVICMAYCENLFSLMTNKIGMINNVAYVNTPINFYIAEHIFEYDWLVVGVALIISFAIEACLWNRLSLCYAAVQLWLKSYLDFELEPTTIYIICIINMAISGYLTWKGIKRLLI